MTQIAFTLAILFGVYLFGYFVGRKQILDEIREVTKDLDK